MQMQMQMQMQQQQQMQMQQMQQQMPYDVTQYNIQSANDDVKSGRETLFRAEVGGTAGNGQNVPPKMMAPVPFNIGHTGSGDIVGQPLGNNSQITNIQRGEIYAEV
jgi:hypothetical protein